MTSFLLQTLCVQIPPQKRYFQTDRKGGTPVTAGTTNGLAPLSRPFGRSQELAVFDPENRSARFAAVSLQSGKSKYMFYIYVLYPLTG